MTYYEFFFKMLRAKNIKIGQCFKELVKKQKCHVFY